MKNYVNAFLWEHEPECKIDSVIEKKVLFF